MQSPDTTDVPLVPYVSTDPGSVSTSESSPVLASDGGRRPTERPLDRPPRTDHATPYTRDIEEIAPFVPDLR